MNNRIWRRLAYAASASVLAVSAFAFCAMSPSADIVTKAFAEEAPDDALVVVSAPEDEGTPDETAPSQEGQVGVASAEGDSDKGQPASDEGELIHYIGEDGGDATISASKCTNADECVEDDACHFKDGWYVVTHWMHLLKRAEVEGDVKIILCDGGSLEQFSGVHVGEGNKLSIYCQSGRSGKLYAGWNGYDGNAGIGGNDGENSGEIYIYGGYVETDAGHDGAGIGGGAHGRCTRFEMFDGEVVAKARSYTPGYYGIDEKCEKMSMPGGGAGVGGGVESEGGTILIHGGKLTAIGGTYFDIAGGAGIGAGGFAASGTIVIDGGEVHATGAKCAAGIGSSMHKDSRSIEISNCKVFADGGEEGAGIGSGYAGNGGRITITNAEVTATSAGGAAIGGGASGGLVECNIHGGSITATSKTLRGTPSTSDRNSSQGAAIGGGDSYGGGVVRIEDDARVAATVEGFDGHACCIGSGKLALQDTSVQLYAGACVRSEDALVMADERDETLAKGHEIVIESCQHEQIKYGASPEGHEIFCPHCALYAEGEKHAHEFGEDGCCVRCRYERPVPRFEDASLSDDGKLGLVFWLEARDYGRFDYGDASVDVSINGGHKRTIHFEMSKARKGIGGAYGFFFPLSYIEMGEPVKAVFHYGDGEQVELTSSVSDLIERMCATDEVRQDQKHALKLLANAGHYLQPWLSSVNGWRLGSYATFAASYPELCDVETAKQDSARHACTITATSKYDEQPDPKRGITSVRCNLILESAITLDATIKTVATSTTDGYRVALGGTWTNSLGAGDPKVTSSMDRDGTWHIRVEGLRLGDLEKPVSLTFEDDGVTYRASLSALSYVHAALNAEDATSDAKQALASLYWLAEHASGFEGMGR